jgi:putative hemolysin
VRKLIPDEALANVTRLQKDNPIIALLTKVARIDKVNEIYDQLHQEPGLKFVERLFEVLDLQVECDQAQLQNIPESGPFIVVANHPFGALDGIALINAIARKRPDFKMMANFLLQNIEPVKDYFVPVNPFEGRKESFNNISGLKNALIHLEKGNGLGIFPAGEVSTIQGDLRVITDRRWQNSAMKIIRNARVPVIPVYFDGSNSRLFHLLGLIHPNLRTLALPSEIFKKKGDIIKLKIGKPIFPKETDVLKNLDTYSRYIRAKTYALGSSFEVKRDYFRILKWSPKPEEIVPKADNDLLIKEIESIQSFKTISYDNFDVYVVNSQKIPYLLRELGRLREITFREVGEGTNNSIDLDEYDLYYDHLILWDRDAKKIAGAYRVGYGPDIIRRFGMRGFYTTSLFKFDYQMRPIMAQSIELGRSFIVKEYQGHRLSLFLLWKGILFYLMSHEKCRYIVGPVSISNQYQEVSKELIIQFLTRHYFDNTLSKFITPKNPFMPKIKNVDTDILLEASKDDVKKLDKIIADIEPANFTVPVLLKKYLQQNAKILAFNADPKFNNAVDGLMILDLMNLPEDTIENLKREMVGAS